MSLGKPEFAPLKSFLVRHSQAYELASVARTYVVVDSRCASTGGRVWGYVSLVASEVNTGPSHAPAVTRWPDTFAQPAIKLARMAVDQALQGQGYGRALVDFVLALVKEHVACHVGCRLLVTDAKKDAVAFYLRMGFTLLDTDNNRARQTPVMFLVLGRLAG